MKKGIAFELYFNELDFIKPQILLFNKKHPDVPIICIFHDDEAKQYILQAHAELKDIAFFMPRRRLERDGYRKTSTCLFMTTEQDRGIPGIPSYCCFHGQPAKGLTLQPTAARGFTGFFLLGPLQRKVIEDYYAYYSHLGPCPILYDIGYPKSDPLLNGCYKRDSILSDLDLPIDRPTVLYAPAFNEYASMREQGPDIIETLLANGKWNVVAKLAVDCWQPPENVYANGGVDWFKKLGCFEQNPNFRLYKEMGADPLLSAADVLITDVSSIAFEFLVLGKPVIHIDTPRFFTHYLKMYFPHEDTESWVNRTGVNAGREFGTLVKNLTDLIPAVENALEEKKPPNFAEEMQNRFLYNPGRATEVFVDSLYALYSEHGRPSVYFWKPYVNEASSRIARARQGIARSLHRLRRKPMANSCASYIDCASTVEAAGRAKLSVNDYLETGEDSPKKIGRRNRIISIMKERGLLEIAGKHVLEIGAGTGRFLEKTITFSPACYEVYELDADWSRYLNDAYGNTSGVDLRVHRSDGKNLDKTPNASCDFMYAHGVFIYTSFAVTVSYLRELARVCARESKICFDLFYDSDWSLQTARAWAHSGHDFPVVHSRQLMESIYKELGFMPSHEFTEIYGASCSRYIVLEKHNAVS